MSSALLDETQPCALVDADQTFVIGGQNLGFPDQLQTDFVMYIGDNDGAYLGVKMRLPRSEDHVATFFDNNGGKSADLSITIRWTLDTFDISGAGLADAQVKTLIPQQQQANEFGLLQVKLRPDEKSLIDGIGFPFRGKDATIDSYVNYDGKIHGRWSLRDIFGQRSFYILVRNTIKASLAKFFGLAPNQTIDDAPYGNVHHWDVNRYKKLMAPNNLKRIQAPARFQFNGLNDASTVITQSIAQDCWWFSLDVQELRKTKLPFLFITIDDKPAAEADRFLAITCLSSGFLKRFERSAKGFTAPHTDLSIAFRGPPAPDTYRDNGKPDKDDLSWSAKVLPFAGPFSFGEHCDPATNNGGYLLLEVHRPRDPTSPAYRIRNHQVQAFPQLKKKNGTEDILSMLSRLGDKMEGIYLNFHDGRVLSRRRVNAANDLFKATKMTRNAMPSHDGGTDPGFSKDNDVLKAILQEFFIGRGYRHPVSQWHKLTNGGSVDTQLSQTAKNISLAEPLSSQRAVTKPQFDVEYADMAVSRLGPGVQDRFRQYIKLVSLRIVGICGAGKHAETILVIATLLFLANTDTNRVHAAASTHKAVHNFADTLHKTGTRVVKALLEHANSDLPRHISLVVRGYNIKEEVGSFIRLVIQGDIEWEMAKWSQQLSPCEWLLKLVNYDEFDLDPMDCPKLFRIRQSFRNDDEYAGLRAFVAGDIPLRKVRDYAAAGETSSGKTRGDDEYEGMTAQERRDSRLRAEHWARGLIQSLLEAIVESADVVCTTTHMSRDAPHSAFRESSKAVVLVDAGTMSKAEAIVVWGPSFKPCAIGGDEEKTTRPFINPHHMQGDKYTNHFGREATISVLRYMMGSGNAMFMA